MGVPSVGVELHGYVEASQLLAEIQLAERCGYSSVWLGDSPLLWREIYVVLGAAAVSTHTISLGLGVTNPLTRHLSVSSAAIRTLQELAGPRINVGIGVGYSALNLAGMRPATREYLEGFVPVMKELIAGQNVTWQSAEMKLNWASATSPTPVYVGASGPKMLRLAGKIGDGVIIGAGVLSPEAFQERLRCVEEGQIDSGRTRGAPFRVMFAPAAAVSEDRTQALAAVRPHVARSLLKSFWQFSPEAQQAQERMLKFYDLHKHMLPGSSHSELVPLDIIPEFAVAGTAKECSDKLEMIFGCGVDEVVIRPYGVGASSRAEMLSAFAEKVVVPLRQNHD